MTNPATDKLYKAGEIIKLPKLGATLEKIAADPLSFYNGSLAEDIVNDLNDKGNLVISESPTAIFPID